MATTAAIDAIKIQLPDEVEDMGVDDDVIAGFIDSGLSQNKTMLALWRVIAGKAATVTDVSEAGSSRSLPLFDRAKQMIDFFQNRSDVEDQQSETLPARVHGVSHTAVRV